MALRKPIVGGNWKMNTTLASARELSAAVRDGVKDCLAACDVVIFPPFPYLDHVGQILKESGIGLGAQDLWHEPDGAFTGEVSTRMLNDLGVRHVIVGHSERRHIIGESDETIRAKLHAALSADLHVTFCIGETLAQRDAGETEEVNLAQMSSGLDGVETEAMERVVIAYEPVWAIGTGRTASPEDAQQVHGVLRAALAERYNEGLARSVRIQYGGSVKASNAASLFAQPDIDGGLIGGASLKGEEFVSIVAAAAGRG